MKKLTVYFRPGVHPQFKEISDFPPAGVKYVMPEVKGDHNSPNYRKMRVRLSTAQHYIPLPRMMYYQGTDGCDLIHSTRGILPLNRKPWIVDCESGAAFSGLAWNSLQQPTMQKIIKKMIMSPYCKRVLPQSEAAKRSLLENMDCNEFEDKIEVLYPAYRTTKLKRKESDTIRISFIGKTFRMKGGHDLQEAFKILNKKYDISLKIKGDVSPEDRLGMKNVHYLEKNLPSRLDFYNEIFGDCDLYVQPTMSDSYGIAILEAMSTGLPVISTDDFTFPELVQNGYNGFTVKTPVSWYQLRYAGDLFMREVHKPHPTMVKELVEKMSLLIEDSKLRKKMGRNSFKMVESGKFSIKQRNKQLRRIYEEAVK